METTARKAGRPRFYTDTKEKLICAEFSQGMTDRQLAEKYFTNVTHIRVIRRRWGAVGARDRALGTTRPSVPYLKSHRHMGFRFTAEEEQAITEAYKAGTSSTVLARRWDTNRQTIKNILNRKGVTLHGKATVNLRYAAVSAAQKARWDAYRAQRPWQRALKRAVRRIKNAITR